MFSFDCCKATNKKPKLLPNSIIYIRRENIYYVVHAGYTVKSMCVDSSVAACGVAPVHFSAMSRGLPVSRRFPLRPSRHLVAGVSQSEMSGHCGVVAQHGSITRAPASRRQARTLLAGSGHEAHATLLVAPGWGTLVVAPNHLRLLIIGSAEQRVQLM